MQNPFEIVATSLDITHEICLAAGEEYESTAPDMLERLAPVVHEAVKSGWEPCAEDIDSLVCVGVGESLHQESLPEGVGPSMHRIISESVA